MKTVNGLVYLPLITSQDFLLLTLDQTKLFFLLLSYK